MVHHHCFALLFYVMFADFDYVYGLVSLFLYNSIILMNIPIVNFMI